MADIIFQIKNQIYETVVLSIAFFKKLNYITVGAVVLALAVFFFRRWEFRRIISFFVSMLVLIIIYVRLEALFLASFSPDASSLGVIILRIVSAFIAGAIFLYHAAVVQ
jgi:hypothetical protein